MKRTIGMFRIDRLCAYVAWVLYAAPTVVIIAWALQKRSAQCAAAILITFAVTAYLAAALTRTSRRFLLLQFPLCLLGLAFVAYTLAFGIPPGSALAGILAFTSFEEVKGFIGMPQGQSLVLLLGVWSMCYLVSASIAPSRPIFAYNGVLLRRIAIVLLMLLFAYTASNPSQLIEGVALEPVVGSLMFLGGDVPAVKAAMRRSEMSKILYGAHRTGGEEVHVLIIGESARRDSWSVYGYVRQTTPYLDSLKNEAIFFQNAIADANFTSFSVPMILTGMNPDNFDINKVRGNLFDLARESGYRAILLENQDLNTAEAVGVDPNLIESPMDFSQSASGRRTFDGQLLPAFRREIARSGKSRFIGIHMMGSHWEYKNRYPENFQHFGPSKSDKSNLVDAYDNTVLYTDWFLRHIIEHARTLAVPATITFIADHGEDLQLLDGEAGHGRPNYTPHAFEVPAFVWANDAYRKLHPGVIAALTNNAAKEIRSHDVFYTVADLMGIEWPGAVAPRSFASNDFLPDTKMKHIAGGVAVFRPSNAIVPVADRSRVPASP